MLLKLLLVGLLPEKVTGLHPSKKTENRLPQISKKSLLITTPRQLRLAGFFLDDADNSPSSGQNEASF